MSSLFLMLCEGFVLKKDQKKESEEDKISLEDLIEREVLTYFTPKYITPVFPHRKLATSTLCQ